MSALEKGDVIHIHEDAKCHKSLQGKVANVDEVKSFGCVAYVILPYEEKAYVRLRREDFTQVRGK